PLSAARRGKSLLAPARGRTLRQGKGRPAAPRAPWPGGSSASASHREPCTMSDPSSAPSVNRRARRTLGLVLLALAAAGGVAAAPLWRWRGAEPTEPDVYALLQVEWPPPRILPETNPSRSQDSAAEERHFRTQVALVKSRLVLNGALRNPKVASLDFL